MKTVCPHCGSEKFIVSKKGVNIGVTLLWAILGAFTLGIGWIILICCTWGCNKPVWICQECGYRWDNSKIYYKQTHKKEIERNNKLGCITLIIIFLFSLICVCFA